MVWDLRRRDIGISVGIIVVFAVATVLILGVGGDVDGEAESSPLSFSEVGTEVGFDYSYASDEGAGGKALLTNAGVYVSDIDNDGRPDVLAIGGTEPVLFENIDGSFERTEMLAEIDIETEVTGALFFDHDNDGFDDLLLLVAGAPPVFLENEEGTLVERDVGLASVDWPERGEPVAAAAADATHNGCLDVVIGYNGDWGSSLPLTLTEGTLDHHSDDNGVRNVLLAGECGSFEEIDGVFSGEHWTLAVSFTDLTGNGYPDIHIGNDFNYDLVYQNSGNGTFEERVLPESNRHAMSSTVADVTGDGSVDLFVTNIYYPDRFADHVGLLRIDIQGNTLFTYEDGEFAERAEEFGVDQGGWGWAAVHEDFANAGQYTLLHTIRPLESETPGTDILSVMEATEEELAATHPYVLYPAVFHPTGDGRYDHLNPTHIGFEWADARGLAVLDFDGDGRLDLVMANARERDQFTTWQGQYRLYQNDVDAGNWLQVDVEAGVDRPSTGATVTVETPNHTHVQVRDSRTTFLAQSWNTLHFGLGDDETATIRVEYPDGTTHEFEDVDVNQRVSVSPSGQLHPIS